MIKIMSDYHDSSFENSFKLQTDNNILKSKGH